jgi:hypothetical protein
VLFASVAFSCAACCTFQSLAFVQGFYQQHPQQLLLSSQEVV